MNETLQKRSAAGRNALTSGPVLAVVLFCLAYGSVMALVIAPRSLLSTTAAAEDDRDTTAAPLIAGSPMTPQVLKAGFTRPVDSSAYGITE